MSLQAYQKTQRSFSDPRDNEYRIFAQVTLALKDVDQLERTDPKVIEALNNNRKLWSALSSDCASDENKLPVSLRAQIISLGLFVNRYSSQVMREGVSVEPLIDINRSIMEGLAMRSQAQAHAKAQAQAAQTPPTVRGTTSLA